MHVLNMENAGPDGVDVGNRGVGQIVRLKSVRIVAQVMVSVNREHVAVGPNSQVMTVVRRNVVKIAELMVFVMGVLVYVDVNASGQGLVFFSENSQSVRKY